MSRSICFFAALLFCFAGIARSGALASLPATYEEQQWSVTDLVSGEVYRTCAHAVDPIVHQGCVEFTWHCGDKRKTTLCSRILVQAIDPPAEK